MTIIEKKQAAEQLIGKPYKFNSWVGVYERYEEKPTKVIAVVTDQESGQTCRWIFDAEVALNKYEEWTQA